MNWYLDVLKKYAVFTGRARRKEYWFFTLFSTIAMIILSIVDALTGTFNKDLQAGLLSGLYCLGVLIPSLAVAVRRLHDTERSAWWLLLIFLPLIGTIVLLVFMFLDGTPGDNRFGPNPKSENSVLPSAF